MKCIRFATACIVLLALAFSFTGCTTVATAGKVVGKGTSKVVKGTGKTVVKTGKVVTKPVRGNKKKDK